MAIALNACEMMTQSIDSVAKYVLVDFAYNQDFLTKIKVDQTFELAILKGHLLSLKIHVLPGILSLTFGQFFAIS